MKWSDTVSICPSKDTINFSTIFLQSGTYPDLWCKGLITPIFKSDDECDTNNYRWIRVTSCLGKFFCLILNEDLTNFTQDNNLIHRSQIVFFLSGHSTADHIFTLRTLIDKHVNQNKNGKVYACFVDLKKAFWLSLARCIFPKIT